MITVLRIGQWGILKNSCRYGCLTCQVTECKWNGITFYVRENIVGERDQLGSKLSQMRYILEVLAPNNHIHKIITLVKERDGLHRDVKQNKDFNQAFIKTIKFKKANAE